MVWVCVARWRDCGTTEKNLEGREEGETQCQWLRPASRYETLLLYSFCFGLWASCWRREKVREGQESESPLNPCLRDDVGLMLEIFSRLINRSRSAAPESSVVPTSSVSSGKFLLATRQPVDERDDNVNSVFVLPEIRMRPVLVLGPPCTEGGVQNR